MCRHSLSFYWGLSFLSCICISCEKGHHGSPLSNVSWGKGLSLNRKVKGQHIPWSCHRIFLVRQDKLLQKNLLEFVLLKWMLLYRWDSQKAKKPFDVPAYTNINVLLILSVVNIFFLYQPLFLTDICLLGSLTFWPLDILKCYFLLLFYFGCKTSFILTLVSWSFSMRRIEHKYKLLRLSNSMLICVLFGFVFKK